ncbi:MAG: acyl dehydratase [Deltaproteobacteria bacterium SG8_13]|nr:MAG: acyl dehydratase [Deltaproteobacteria bacterium SG8_13]
MTAIRKKTIEGLQAGDRFSVTRTFCREDVTLFADISRDYNPVHFERRWTKIKGFKDTICHGLLVAGMVTEIGGQIGWLAAGMDFRFKQPVYLGDTITCAFTITDIDDQGRARAEAVFRNQDDDVVLRAVITGIVPGRAEKEVLQQMVAEGDPTNKLSGT